MLHPSALQQGIGGMNTGRMTAVCGLLCNDCFAFIARQENNDDMREKAVELWSTDEDRLKPSEIE